MHLPARRSGVGWLAGDTVGRIHLDYPSVAGRAARWWARHMVEES